MLILIEPVGIEMTVTVILSWIRCLILIEPVGIEIDFLLLVLRRYI
mgnify:CR=1 FL=1